jgi:hypothetical protein
MNYKIKLLTPSEIASTPSAKPFGIFDPIELEVYFINTFEKTTQEATETTEAIIEKFVRVDTKITEVLTNEQGSFVSRTDRYTHHTFPFAVWQAAVKGVDLDTGQPILNETVLNQICSQFGVKLI